MKGQDNDHLDVEPITGHQFDSGGYLRDNHSPGRLALLVDYRGSHGLFEVVNS
ncbi:MAG: hypothetical protein ACJAYU_005371 [Bradymonadia bacterium]|jgi:hypothetical protein